MFMSIIRGPPEDCKISGNLVESVIFCLKC